MGRVAFGSKAVQQIRDIYTRVRDTPYGGAAPTHEPRLWNPGVMEAIVTSAISAASGTTYGTGQAQIKVDNGSGVAIDDPNYPIPVAVTNWYTGSGTVAINTHIFICWRQGGFRLLGADC